MLLTPASALTLSDINRLLVNSRNLKTEFKMQLNPSEQTRCGEVVSIIPSHGESWPSESDWNHPAVEMSTWILLQPGKEWQPGLILTTSPSRVPASQGKYHIS